ncbi:dynein associated protein-domain-containing protein [Phycomyces nitens]|nr:dynein associated protein-domain-containing protein [Phycomyces nitens]
MITLDKEVAEERAENLQQEVSVLKDKIEEISVDLDVLKKETDIINRTSTREGEEKTPLEVVQLERHNERLKEALMRYRDSATEHEADLNRKIKILEKESYEFDEVRVQFIRTKERLEMAESLIDELKQRLDDALGAEEMVEQLTEKNLTLAEKFEEMKMNVEDLEALKELADELEENHMETEKQLQAEIDHRDMLLREQLDRLRSSEETNADYEGTIQQFRELVVNLQSDLEQLRHKEESQMSEKRNLSSQSQAMMSLNMQLQSTVMKAQAKAIDLELRKLEATQANDRLSYIQPYLPDSFFKTENDPISCLLLFKRVVFKSEVIIKHLDQNHPVSEKIMDTVTENLVSVCEMRQRAGWLSDLAKRFVAFIKDCKPETFTRMGQIYHDLVGTERRLNGIVELLRTDEVNESECLVELQRIISQLEHLTEVYLVQNGETSHAEQFFGLTRALDLNADRMTVELTYVKQAVSNATRIDGINITEGLETLDYDYMDPLNNLIAQAKNSKIIAKKLLRQLEDLSEQALTLKAEHLHCFKTLYAISSKLSRFCFEVYRQIATYVDAKRGSKEDISLAYIQQIVYSKADEILEIAESKMWDGCLKTLKSLTNELNDTVTRVDNDNKMNKISTGVAPWIQRASDMKAEVVISHDMERKLQQHSEEIVKLIKDVKLKDQALQESGVKVEHLEKRMEAVKKQAEQISSLEETLEKVQAQETMYAEAVDNLQAEYDALEQENAQLKKAVAKKEEKRLSLPKKAEFDLAEGAPAENESGSYYEIANQIESLKAAIRYLRAENTHLKSCDMIKALSLDCLPEMPQPKSLEAQHTDEDEVAVATEGGDEVKEQDMRAVMRSVALETRVLVKDMRVASASPKVVVLSADRRGGKWQSMKKTPDYQYQTQQSVIHTLKQRSEQLRTKMHQLQKDQDDNSIYVAPNSTKTLHQSLNQGQTLLSQSLAKIQIPRLSSLGKARHCIQLQSAAEFERIHSIFIR